MQAGVVPEVAVVVPVYNGCWSIRRCLDAILRERGELGLQVVVVDDGSTDGTPKILREYAREVHALRIENSGPGAARNVGVMISSAPLVAFMDSDDEILPGRLKLQADYMTSHSEVVLTFGAIAFRSHPAEPYLSTMEPRDEWATMVDPYRHLLTSGGECVNTMTAMVRRDCLESVGGFATRYRCGEDTDLWVRLAELGPFAYHGRPMAIVNDTKPDGKLTRSSRVYTEGPRALIEILRRDTRLSPADRTIAKGLVKRSAEMMLRYDWTERNRAALQEDIEFCRPIFGDSFALKWNLIGLIPSSAGRALRKVKRALNSRTAQGSR